MDEYKPKEVDFRSRVQREFTRLHQTHLVGSNKKPKGPRTHVNFKVQSDSFYDPIGKDQIDRLIISLIAIRYNSKQIIILNQHATQYSIGKYSYASSLYVYRYRRGCYRRYRKAKCSSHEEAIDVIAGNRRSWSTSVVKISSCQVLILSLRIYKLGKIKDSKLPRPMMMMLRFWMSVGLARLRPEPNNFKLLSWSFTVAFHY